VIRVRVVLTSKLPIDLAGQLAALVPAAKLVEPAGGRAQVGELDLSDADALICLLTDRVDNVVIARAPRLRVIANCAAGIDNVDVGAATAAAIAVTNTPDVLAEATAELTVALMFAAARRLGDGERLIRDGRWRGWALDQLLGVPLAGRTLGIVGLGKIGQAVARRAIALGMRVIYDAPHESPAAAALPAIRVATDELFALADVVSLHCPLTHKTRRLVDARRLGLMKPTAVLVNTARGACIDDVAVAAALESGRLFAAGLDVFTGEPEIEPRLLAAPRIVLAPHLGSATTETRMRMAQLSADAAISMLLRRRPTNLVNPEAWPAIAARWSVP
jgi:glyoxylate reductase